MFLFIKIIRSWIGSPPLSCKSTKKGTENPFLCYFFDLFCQFQRFFVQTGRIIANNLLFKSTCLVVLGLFPDLLFIKSPTAARFDRIADQNHPVLPVEQESMIHFPGRNAGIPVLKQTSAIEKYRIIQLPLSAK